MDIHTPQITNTHMACHTDSSHMFVTRKTFAGNTGTLGEGGIEGGWKKWKKNGERMTTSEAWWEERGYCG